MHICTYTVKFRIFCFFLSRNFIFYYYIASQIQKSLFHWNLTDDCQRFWIISTDDLEIVQTIITYIHMYVCMHAFIRLYVCAITCNNPVELANYIHTNVRKAFTWSTCKSYYPFKTFDGFLWHLHSLLPFFTTLKNLLTFRDCEGQPLIWGTYIRYVRNIKWKF